MVFAWVCCVFGVILLNLWILFAFAFGVVLLCLWYFRAVISGSILLDLPYSWVWFIGLGRFWVFGIW